MTHYAVSRDGRRVLYTSDSTAPPGLWIVDLEHGLPPLQLTVGGEDRAYFGAPGEIIYLSKGLQLMRIKEDGSGRQAVSSDSIGYLQAVSPDGQWAIVNALGPKGVGMVNGVRAYHLPDGRPALMCQVCVTPFGPRATSAPFITWAPSGRFLYLSLYWAGIGQADKTAVIPLRGAPFNLAPHGTISEAELQKTFGARIINERDVYPGQDPETYTFTRYAASTNIYRIILP